MNCNCSCLIQSVCTKKGKHLIISPAARLCYDDAHQPSRHTLQWSRFCCGCLRPLPPTKNPSTTATTVTPLPQKSDRQYYSRSTPIDRSSSRCDPTTDAIQGTIVPPHKSTHTATERLIDGKSFRQTLRARPLYKYTIGIRANISISVASKSASDNQCNSKLGIIRDRFDWKKECVILNIILPKMYIALANWLMLSSIVG